MLALSDAHSLLVFFPVQSPEMMHIKHAKWLVKRAEKRNPSEFRRRLPLPYQGYGLPADVYAAGMVMGQLLYGVSEDDVADLDNDQAKGEAFVDRALELASRGQANLGHHLMIQMLNPDPKQRITCDVALRHPWFTD